MSEPAKPQIILSNPQIVDGKLVCDIEGFTGVLHVPKLHIGEPLDAEGIQSQQATLRLTGADQTETDAILVDDVATGHVAYRIRYNREPD